MEKINDKTPMQFGKFKGALLGNVPAKYLLFLFDIGKSGRYTSYIVKNMNVLKAEIKSNK